MSNQKRKEHFLEHYSSYFVVIISIMVCRAPVNRGSTIAEFTCQQLINDLKQNHQPKVNEMTLL